MAGETGLAHTGAGVLQLPLRHQVLWRICRARARPNHAAAERRKRDFVLVNQWVTNFVLPKAASELGVYLVGGSIPERDGDKLYNTSTVFDPKGNLVARHRKVGEFIFVFIFFAADLYHNWKGAPV